VFENLFESLKKSFISDIKDDSKLSNDPDLDITSKTLSNNDFGGAMVVNNDNYQDNIYSFNQELDQGAYQNQIIESYRMLAGDSEVSNGIDIIVNEMAWTLDHRVFRISIDEENNKIADAINEKFKEVLDIANIRENIFDLCRQMYIDGQLNVSLAYNKKQLDKGIRSIKILEPMNLYFDKKERLWKYSECVDSDTLYSTEESQTNNTFTESELVHVDYGLYSKVHQQSRLTYQVNLGYLENVLKTANMLQTLENMLVPLRYSRSVSRRLFNIDVADLPPKQAKEVMATIRAEFTYKKTYDPKTGTIKNIKNTQPMVEDYWLSNRSGSRGTTVDTMDEKGAIMDMEDIRYAAKKLFTSMNIPDEFNPYSEDPGSFSFDSTEVTQSLLKFYIFISRLRLPITKLIKEMLRRQLVSTGVFKDSEWKNYEKKINIEFTAESTFIENMEKELFLKALDGFVNVKENIGESISLQTAVSKTFGWSSEQLADELKKIEEEKLEDTFGSFYDRDKEGDADGGSWR